MLRSRPTCHGIRRTVIDTARESLVFHFFRIILCLDPCQTGLLQLLDLHSPHITLSDSCLEPHHAYCLTDSLIPCYLYPFPLDVIMTYDSDPDSDPILSYDIIAYRSLTIRPLPLTPTIRTAICYWLIPLA